MQLFRVLFVLMLFSGGAFASQPLLEVNAQGQHVHVHGKKGHEKLQEIKQRKPLIEDTASLIKKNVDAIKAIPMDREIDLDTIWAQLKENPYLLFLECVDPDCPLQRAANPQPRALFEQEVLKAALENISKSGNSTLHLIFFGSGSLFDTFVHVSQIIQEAPTLKSLEIDLVDCQYSEYIEYIQDSKKQDLSYLKFDRIDKQNWFNLATIRFALFSSLLEEMAPDTNITLRISDNLCHLSEDQLSGSITSTPNLLIAGDIFEPSGGIYAIHDLIVEGVKASNEGAVFLILSRDESPGQTHKIAKLVKSISAVKSREELEKITYSEADDWLNKIEKRLICAADQIEECT